MRLKTTLLVATMLLGFSVSAAVLASASSTAKEQGVAAVSINTVTAPVNVNTADLQALKTIKGLGSTKAQAIIDFRAKNGHFKTVQEVENVPGIGVKLLEKIQSQITV